MPIIDILLWALSAVLVLVGLAGVVLPVLPGLPFVLMGLGLVAWLDHFEHVSGVTLGVLAALTIIGLILDFVASSLGAKRVGASPQAVTGAAIGSVVGLFFGIPGLILGPFAGAVLGELKARGGLQQATAAGVGTFVGLLLGTLAKLALGLMMLGVFGFAWFF